MTVPCTGLDVAEAVPLPLLLLPLLLLLVVVVPVVWLLPVWLLFLHLLPALLDFLVAIPSTITPRWSPELPSRGRPRIRAPVAPGEIAPPLLTGGREAVLEAVVVAGVGVEAGEGEWEQGEEARGHAWRNRWERRRPRNRKIWKHPQPLGGGEGARGVRFTGVFV